MARKLVSLLLALALLGCMALGVSAEQKVNDWWDGGKHYRGYQVLESVPGVYITYTIWGQIAANYNIKFEVYTRDIYGGNVTFAGADTATNEHALDEVVGHTFSSSQYWFYVEGWKKGIFNIYLGLASGDSTLEMGSSWLGSGLGEVGARVYMAPLDIPLDAAAAPYCTVTQKSKAALAQEKRKVEVWLDGVYVGRDVGNILFPDRYDAAPGDLKVTNIAPGYALADVTAPTADSYRINLKTVRFTAAASAGDGIASVSGSGSYRPGETVAFQASCLPGWRFAGWYQGDAQVSPEADFSFSMPGNDLVYTAKAVTASDTPYTVRHMVQDYGQTEYRLHRQEQLTGTTNGTTQAQAMQIPGYTPGAVTQKTIAGAGTTVVEILYTENTRSAVYLPNNPAWGTVTPGEETVGEATGQFTGSRAEAKEGYYFAGWFREEGCSELLSRESHFVPGESGAFYACFLPVESTLTVQVHTEGVFGDKTLAFSGQVRYSVKPGSPDADGEFSYSLTDGQSSNPVSLRAGDRVRITPETVEMYHGPVVTLTAGEETFEIQEPLEGICIRPGENVLHITYKSRDILPVGIDSGSLAAAIWALASGALLIFRKRK